MKYTGIEEQSRMLAALIFQGLSRRSQPIISKIMGNNMAKRGRLV